jgi:hypothetical protein
VRGICAKWRFESLLGHHRDHGLTCRYVYGLGCGQRSSGTSLQVIIMGVQVGPQVTERQRLRYSSQAGHVLDHTLGYYRLFRTLTPDQEISTIDVPVRIQIDWRRLAHLIRQ